MQEINEFKYMNVKNLNWIQLTMLQEFLEEKQSDEELLQLVQHEIEWRNEMPEFLSFFVHETMLPVHA